MSTGHSYRQVNDEVTLYEWDSETGEIKEIPYEQEIFDQIVKDSKVMQGVI